MKWFSLGSFFMFIAVALGAFGAHALKNRLSMELLAVYETGVRYQVYHALGLFIVGILAERQISTLVPLAGRLFTAGIFLFSGSLYAYVFSGQRWFGMITPVGGVAFLVGWALLGVAAFKK